jgi:BolA family transcriptional regulator, general stress-responsive regulator
VNERLERIRRTLETAFEPESMELVDESHLHAGHEGARSGGGHYDLVIVADCFRDKNPVARHRMVYSALQHEMGPDIHALSIKAYTPDEI